MTRSYRPSDDRLDVQIRDAESRLDTLYRKRAGRRNGYGWTYCDCGRRNLPDGMENDCRHCEGDRLTAQAQARVQAHDSGMHAIAPDPACINCHAAVAQP